QLPDAGVRDRAADVGLGLRLARQRDLERLSRRVRQVAVVVADFEGGSEGRSYVERHPVAPGAVVARLSGAAGWRGAQLFLARAPPVVDRRGVVRPAGALLRAPGSCAASRRCAAAASRAAGPA